MSINYAFAIFLRATAAIPREVFLVGFYFSGFVGFTITVQIHLIHFDELNEDFFDFLSRRVFGTNFEMSQIESFDFLLGPPFIHLPIIS